MQTEEVVFQIEDVQTGDISVYCFVCTGNTCRSPMAAAVVNQLGKGKGIAAFSRGIMAEAGAPISKNAAAALANAGIPEAEYALHTATQISAADMERCDALFAISPTHANALMMAFPQYAGKIRVLGDIADPYGGDLACYERCLDEIRAAVLTALPTLRDGTE